MNQILSKKLPNGKNVLGFKNSSEGYKMIENGKLKDLELYAGDIINLNDDFYLVIPVIQIFENGKRLDYFSLTKVGISFQNPLKIILNKNRNTLKMLENSTVYVLGNVFNKPSDLILSSVLVKYSFKQYKGKIIKDLNSILETLQGVPVPSIINKKQREHYNRSKQNKSKSHNFNNKNRNVKQNDLNFKKKQFEKENAEFKNIK